MTRSSSDDTLDSFDRDLLETEDKSWINIKICGCYCDDVCIEFGYYYFKNKENNFIRDIEFAKKKSFVMTMNRLRIQQGNLALSKSMK